MDRHGTQMDYATSRMGKSESRLKDLFLFSYPLSSWDGTEVVKFNTKLSAQKGVSLAQHFSVSLLKSTVMEALLFEFYKMKGRSGHIAV